MANTSANVTAGKPAVSGGIYFAPTGTALPTDATTALNAAFKCLGYISDAGVTNNISRDTEDAKAWGGDVVNTSQTSFKDTFKFTLIETLNVEVLKAVFGADNVTGTLATGITVKVNSKELADAEWVVETIANGGVAKRLVIPKGKAFLNGEVVYKDSEVTGYEIQLTATPDAQGQTHYEYSKSA